MPQLTVSLYAVDVDNRGYEQYPDLEKEAPQAVLDVADQVFADFDGAHCKCCNTNIGYYLYEREDQYGLREVAGFTYFWVADDGEHQWALCEDCTTPFDWGSMHVEGK